MLQLLQPKLRSSTSSMVAAARATAEADVELQLVASYKSKTQEIEQELLSAQIKKELTKLDKEKTGSLSKTEIVDFFVSKGLNQAAGTELFNSIPIE